MSERRNFLESVALVVAFTAACALPAWALGLWR